MMNDDGNPIITSESYSSDVVKHQIIACLYFRSQN